MHVHGFIIPIMSPSSAHAPAHPASPAAVYPTMIGVAAPDNNSRLLVENENATLDVAAPSITRCLGGEAPLHAHVRLQT